jgi:hypothetical protein
VLPFALWAEAADFARKGLGMDENFALLDFALVAAPVTKVAQAAAGIPGAAPSSGTSEPRLGVLQRFMGRTPRVEENRTPAPWLLHPAGLLGAQPLTLHNLTRAAETTPALCACVRISGPVGETDLTLIEFHDPQDATKPFAQRLSLQLPGHDVFSFRYSGVRHTGSDFGFMICREGRILRRAASMCPATLAPATMRRAQWSAIDTGRPHPVENGTLPAPSSAKSDIMTPERQGSILQAMGLDPEALFSDPTLREQSLVLSTQAGGLPVSEAESFGRRRSVTKAKPANRDTMMPPPSSVPFAPEKPASSPQPDRPQPDRPQPDRMSAPLPDPQTPPALDTSLWEAEVTQLLLDAVAAGLAPSEHVPWLLALTQELEAGDIQAALSRATDLIAVGDRPPSVRKAEVARLHTLYAHLRAPMP